MSDQSKGVKVFSPNLDLLKWVKEPTHYPEITPINGTVYSIEVGENGDMPFFAHPSPNKRFMN